MADLYLATTTPQTNDSEKLLLARLGAVIGGKTNLLPGCAGVALVTAARTVSTGSAVIQVPSWAQNMIAHLDVNVASGTGGLKLFIRNGLDSGMVYGTDHFAAAFITVVGARVAYLGTCAQNTTVGMATGFTYVMNCPLGPWLTLGCQVGDASSYTYGLRYAFTP